MSEHDAHDDEGPASRFRRLGRRILREGEASGRFSAREALGAVLEGSDKAKTEVVRVVAREVRTYLEELGLREVLTDYSLEVHASFNLRRLSEAEKAPRDGGEKARRTREPRATEPAKPETEDEGGEEPQP